MLKSERRDSVSDKFIFERVEKKYRISRDTYTALIERISDKILPDEHGNYTICSLYLDTPDFLLIRNSMEAKAYKEKLRIRCYGIPNKDSRIFFEIKKKLCGVVYKRRVPMTLAEAEEYLQSGTPPSDSQIMREIDYSMRRYNLPAPQVCVIYERDAFYLKENSDIRITFDTNARYRYGFPDENSASVENYILGGDEGILEIKTFGAMPVWLSHTLSELSIFPSPFSKYAHAYRNIVSNNQISEMKGNSLYV